MKNKFIIFLELKKQAKQAKKLFTKHPRNTYKNDELISSLKSKLLLFRDVSWLFWFWLTLAREISKGKSFGSAWLGLARLGLAWLGLARLGSARLGSARLGSARSLFCRLAHLKHKLYFIFHHSSSIITHFHHSSSIITHSLIILTR